MFLLQKDSSTKRINIVIMEIGNELFACWVLVHAFCLLFFVVVVVVFCKIVCEAIKLCFKYTNGSLTQS